MVKKKIYKASIKYNEPIKGHISKEEEERAEILYNHPDNERTVRYEPINYDEIGLKLLEDYKEIPIAEPVIYVEKSAYTNMQSDLQQERRNAVNNARIQQRIVNNTSKVNSQTRIDYINKQAKGLGENRFRTIQRTNEEFVVGKKRMSLKPEKNYEEIAELFYPNMEVKREKNPLIKKDYASEEQEPNFSSEHQIPNMPNVEKTLYPNGTLGEMAPKKLYDLTKYGEEYEKVGNVLYPKTDDPKINELKKAAKDENFQIQKDRIVTHAKNIGGTALILGSSFVPGLGEAKVTVGLAKTLGPVVGKKIAGTLAQGIVKGPIQGSIAGFGEGIINDENLLESSAKGAGIGLASGSIIGLGVGKYLQVKALKQLDELVDKRIDWGIAYRKYSYKPEEAIEFLLKNKKGFVPNAIYKKGVGNIDFVWGVGGKKGYGLAHIIDQRNSQNINGIDFVRKIPTIIKEGRVKRPQNQNVIFIETKDDRAVVKLVWDIKERKWIVTSFKLNTSKYGN